MNTLLNPGTGTFIHRVALGTVLIAHSLYLKLVVFTLPGTVQFFESLGLPGLLAYAVFAVEAATGIALVLGIQVRLASAVVIPVLLGATWAHAGNGWVFSNAGGGWEYPLLLVVLAVVQVGLGAGRFALGNAVIHKRSSEEPLAGRV